MSAPTSKDTGHRLHILSGIVKELAGNGVHLFTAIAAFPFNACSIAGATIGTIVFGFQLRVLLGSNFVLLALRVDHSASGVQSPLVHIVVLRNGTCLNGVDRQEYSTTSPHCCASSQDLQNSFTSSRIEFSESIISNFQKWASLIWTHHDEKFLLKYAF